MKAVRSVGVASFMLYGAFLAALWTFVYGLVIWVMGWIFGAQAWWIEMDLASWTTYTFGTIGFIFLQSLVSAIVGAFAGLVTAVLYNAVAGMMGGLKISLE